MLSSGTLIVLNYLENRDSSTTSPPKAPIVNIPPKIKLMNLDLLDPISSTCLGLTTKVLYPIHKRLHGVLPLDKLLEVSFWHGWVNYHSLGNLLFEQGCIHPAYNQSEKTWGLKGYGKGLNGIWIWRGQKKFDGT